MIFKQHHSGSHGNLYQVIANNGHSILIDPGVQWKKVQQALKYKLENVDFALCSHFHGDHSCSVRSVMRAGIDVYSSSDTFRKLDLEDERRAKNVIHFSLFHRDGFDVLCFNTIHDCDGSMGFVVRESGEYLLFCTDTACIKEKFPYPFSIIALEVSYDKEILIAKVKAKTINEQLAKRLLSSHQEKSVAMKYIEDSCDLSKCRQIHLLHTSDANLDKEKTRKEVEDKFFIETVVI